MNNIQRSLRGALLAGPAALLLACGDSVTDPDLQTFMGCPVREVFFGESVAGSLSSADCTIRSASGDITYAEMWLLDARNDEPLVIIDLESFDFDAVLVLYDRDTGEIVADNDDFNEYTTDARLAGELPRGRYVIAATTYLGGETGQYVLTVD